VYQEGGLLEGTCHFLSALHVSFHADKCVSINANKHCVMYLLNHLFCWCGCT